MTYDEYLKRQEIITKITVLFVTVDVIVTIAGLIVDGIINGPTFGPNPIFVLIMLAVMITHGMGSVYLDNELEKEYEQNKKD